MPRQRMVKPDFFESESLAECNHSARLCFIGLWVMSDDNGNCKLNPRRLNRQIFPDDNLTNGEFLGLLQQLERVGCIKVYQVDGEDYLSVVNFKVYQTVKNPSKSTVPKPPERRAKVKTTAFFDDYQCLIDARYPSTTPGLTQAFPSAADAWHSMGATPALHPSYTSTTPGLTHEVPPSKEVRKEVISSSPREEEEITPANGRRCAVDNFHLCPECGERLHLNNQSGRFACESCGCMFDESELS